MSIFTKRRIPRIRWREEATYLEHFQDYFGFHPDEVGTEEAGMSIVRRLAHRFRAMLLGTDFDAFLTVSVAISVQVLKVRSLAKFDTFKSEEEREAAYWESWSRLVAMFEVARYVYPKYGLAMDFEVLEGALAFERFAPRGRRSSLILLPERSENVIPLNASVH